MIYMMLKKELLIQRLHEIGAMLEQKGDALALLGLGSVGVEIDRLDDYSDLDFFVIVALGSKMRFIDHLDWLEDTHPLAYHFKNSVDGYKIMFEDGIYGEFAIFEEWELASASYAEGRILWKDPSYQNVGIVIPSFNSPKVKAESVDYALNEALTNLYVGLCRYARGEKLSATKFVEVYAVDSLISVMHLLDCEVDFYPDKFGNERRIEMRFPKLVNHLGRMAQGYDHVPESAIYTLNYLEGIFPINKRLSSEIRCLAEHCRL
jgi:lincosamide nucleotidyltransferase